MYLSIGRVFLQLHATIYSLVGEGGRGKGVVCDLTFNSSSQLVCANNACMKSHVQY